ncbi:MAG TPA: nitroreductase family protein [Ktedonobacteraceae bacterium]|nr:nitroreductase family protein [Ktedonobacteraceae bacterium]
MTTTDITSFRKPAEAHHPIHTLIGERWSPRAFDDRPVEREKIHSLFEAARWAASANNMQPWHFIMATKENAEDHARFVEILMEGNRTWAQHAPVLVLVVARLYSFPGKEQISFYDTGMAAENLVTQAVDLGLATHQMGGFDGDKARELLGIPEGYTPLSMIAIGYPGTHERLTDVLREREVAPRVRKSVEEFVAEGRWSL